MQSRNHPLAAPGLGARRSVTSFHFGTPGDGLKVYIQAGLHADEIPGMLVCHHLKAMLAELETAGRLAGEVVLVPVCNPVGLDQSLLHDAQGRFELSSGENFNRGYPQFAEAIGDALEGALGADAAANRALIRGAMHGYLAAQHPVGELASLRHALVSLAFDADIVLDLHADFEAVVHLYTETPYVEDALPLCRLLGARALLVAEGSGGQSFDEALSGVWWQLARRYPDANIPLACFATTVELRGEADVDHRQAGADAAALLAFLTLRGVVAGEAPQLPLSLCEPTPLAGSEPLIAPEAGVVVYRKAVGDRVAAGETVCEIVDPVSGRVLPLAATVDGVLYARAATRFALAGANLGKVAGRVPFRSGQLLSA